MNTAIKTENYAAGFGVGRNTDSKRTGRQDKDKAENSFMDAFSKVMKDNKKTEAPTEKTAGKQAADRVSEDIPEERLPAAKEDEAPAEDQEKKSGLKAQDPILAMMFMMTAEPEIPVEENQFIQEGFIEIPAAAAVDIAAVLPVQESEKDTDDGLFKLQNQQMQAFAAGEAQAQAAIDSVSVLGADKTVLPESLPKSPVKNNSPQEVKAPAEEIVQASDKNMTAAMKDENAGDGRESDFSQQLKGQAELMKSMARAGRETKEMDPKKTEEESLTGLEELKDSAKTKSTDVMERMAAANLGGKFHMAADKQETADNMPVLDQLKTGIEQAVKTKQQELTFHLKPEGLGDIVIRLASAGGRITVHIGASDSDTQKLITSQMMNLKEMLEPLHAEVGEVYHDSQAAMNFLEYGGQMQEQTGRQQPAYNGKQHEHAQDEEEILAAAEQMMAEGGLGRLYAYI